MRKRMLSLFLAVVLCLSLLPTAALAADDAETVAKVTINDAVDDYASLQDAFDAVKDCTESSNASIKLMDDITLTRESGLTINGGMFTLDLNGKTLKHNDANTKVISMSDGTVTLTDSGSASGVIGQRFSMTGGTLNMQGGTIQKLYVNGSATLNASGGSISSNLVVGNKDGEINLSGGFYACIQGYTTTEGKKTPGDLLAQGYAYQINESLQPLNTVAENNTNKNIENVTVVKCPHTDVTSGNCQYCNTALTLSPVFVGGVQLLLDTNYINNNGSVEISTNGSCNAIVTGNDTDGYTLTINDLNVTGKTDNTSTKYKSAAIYTETDKPLTIFVEEASTVTGAQTKAHSAGVYAENALTITGTGTLTATGGRTATSYCDSYGVKCNQTLTINDTTIVAIGGNAGESSVGVFASSITISGDDTVVTAVGGDGGWASYGIGSSESIVLSSGRVEAQANGTTASYKKAASQSFICGDPAKEVKYTDESGAVETEYNKVSNKTKLTVTLGDPAPVSYTVWFYTYGGKLTGTGVTEVTPNTLYTMTYQQGQGMTLPKDTVTKDGCTFGGWYDKSDFSTGSGPIGSISAGSSGGKIYYAKWEPLDFSKAVITLGTQGIYNGTEQGVYITSVTLGGKTLTKDVDYKIVSGGTATNVENTTLTIQGIGAYSGTATIDWSLQKASPSLTVDFAQSVIDTLQNGVDYTGSPIRIATPLKDGKSGMGRVDTYYEASGSHQALSAAKDAGYYSVIFVINEGTNYKYASLVVGTLTVRKINYNGEKNRSVTVRYDKANRDVSVTLPEIPEGASYGAPELGSAHYANGAAYPYTIFPSGQRGIENGTLYITTDPVSESGIYADITIPVTGAKNYNDYVITVRVTCEDRTTVSFSGIEDNQTFVYDGTAKTPEGTLTVSDDVGAASLEVRYAKVANGTATPISGAPTDVGSYQVTYSVPDSNERYKGSVTYSFTITPSPVVITVKDQNMYIGAAVPTLDESSYTVSGLVGNDKLTTAPTLKYVDAAGKEIKPDTSKAGKTIIRASNADAGANYEISYEDGTLTVSRRSSSSSGTSTLYPITVKDSANGDAASSVKSASKGSTVTITVTPDKGYTLETLTVTDASGKELPLTDKGNGKYTFTMPASSVTIKAAFMDDNTMLNFFVDVKASDYYYDAVLWAAQKGITSGISATEFGPDQPCTRAQIVTFLWRAADSPEPKNVSSFADVSASSYYAKAVAWAVENGITTGTTATTFSPNSECTRAQAVAFLFRYTAPEAVTLQELVSGYADAASVPGYALPAMNWALASGIVQGDGRNLMANDPCTRAQIVTFLYRALEK